MASPVSFQRQASEESQLRNATLPRIDRRADSSVHTLTNNKNDFCSWIDLSASVGLFVVAVTGGDTRYSMGAGPRARRSEPRDRARPYRMRTREEGELNRGCGRARPEPTDPASPSRCSIMTRLLSVTVLVLAVISGAVDVRPSAQQVSESPPWATSDLRAGIIGTDTSHVPAFTAIFEAHPEWRIKIVAAFKGGSPDLSVSADRVEGFAKTIQETHGVELVETIDALLAKVDVVLLQSVDGRPHLAQVTPVLEAGKRVFIDKPLAASLEDVHRIVQLSKETGTPFFSSSSFRFYADIPRLRDNPGVGQVTKVQASSRLMMQPYHPDLYYYGIHGVEALYAVMGTGCVSVSRKIEGNSDVTTCRWQDGRIGVYNGLLGREGETPPLIRVWGQTGTTDFSGAGGHGGSDRGWNVAYYGLVREIAEFFHTGRPPVDLAETIELFEFMTAAQLSKERNGAQVELAELRK
jgi:predicted dehydrogenase